MHMFVIRGIKGDVNEKYINNFLDNSLYSKGDFFIIILF